MGTVHVEGYIFEFRRQPLVFALPDTVSVAFFSFKETSQSETRKVMMVAVVVAVS